MKRSYSTTGMCDNVACHVFSLRVMIPRWQPLLTLITPLKNCWTGLRNVAITYVEPDGTEKTVEAAIGQNLLDVAHDNGVELEGACGGELACSTCHLIFDPAVYDSLPPKQDEEEDMLDLAFEVTET